MPISIIATKKVEWPKAYRDATEKYASQVKLSADGRNIYNYVAGSPFPVIDPADPLAGFKLMWDHEQRPYIIDNIGTEWIVELINSKGELERKYASSFWRRMMWSGRLYTDPKPVIPHNPAVRYTEQWGPMFVPEDLKGAGVVNYRYLPRMSRMIPICTCPSCAAFAASVQPTAAMPFGEPMETSTPLVGLTPRLATGLFGS